MQKLFKYIVEFSMHMAFALIVSFAAGLSINETALVVLGAYLIDIDHLFYILIKEKLYTPRKISVWVEQEYSIHRPHFFVFHTIELLAAFLIISFYLNWSLFLVFVGFLTNYIVDVLTYIFIYRSTKPWLRYFSLLNYLRSLE